MSYIKLWIHAVWTTKNRKPYLTGEIRNDVFRHIKNQAYKKGIHVDFINGYIDHVHCLISLKTDQCIADVLEQIKGESSFWVNKTNLTEKKFGWQRKYYAISISRSHVERVRDYIRNQEAHHSRQSLDDEIDELFPGEDHPGSEE